MARNDDFRTLEKDVYDKWDVIEQMLDRFDWDFFSDSGAVTAQGYELLDDAFQDSSTKEEVAAYVANEVYVMKKRIKNTQNTLNCYGKKCWKYFFGALKTVQSYIN